MAMIQNKSLINVAQTAGLVRPGVEDFRVIISVASIGQGVCSGTADERSSQFTCDVSINNIVWTISSGVAVLGIWNTEAKSSLLWRGGLPIYSGIHGTVPPRKQGGCTKHPTRYYKWRPSATPDIVTLQYP